MRPSTASLPTKTILPRSSRKAEAAVFAVLAVLSVVSLRFGGYPLTFSDLFRIVNGKETGTAMTVFFGLRLPRVLTAILAGGVLGVTGAVCQTVFSNPLASPDLTGVASGCSLGAAAAILLGLPAALRVPVSFAGGVAALALLLLLVRVSGKHGAEPRSTYLLAGILISAAADAGLMMLKTAADPERELAAIEYWTMGSFAAMTGEKALTAACFSLPPLLLLMLFSRQALILSRGREEARAVGVSPAVWQTVLLLLCTLAVAGVISAVGVIGFVGLIVPHIALALGGSRGRGFLPLCFGVGGILTVLSDLLARTVVRGAELPVSIFCVGFAVLWFAFLFCRRKGVGTEC